MGNVRRVCRINRHGKSFWQAFPREGIGPLRRIFLCLRFQIVVKITAADHIIPLLVICFHIPVQHSKLPCADFVAAAIGRHMHIVDTKLPVILRRNPGNRIAPVQVNKLAERF